MYDWDVWIGGYATKRDPYPAILVDRRKITTDGRPEKWEGLIVYATGGGDADWKVEFRWVNMHNLKPLDDGL
jgi:hypothetical protein